MSGLQKLLDRCCLYPLPHGNVLVAYRIGQLQADGVLKAWAPRGQAADPGRTRRDLWNWTVLTEPAKVWPTMVDAAKALPQPNAAYRAHGSHVVTCAPWVILRVLVPQTAIRDDGTAGCMMVVPPGEHETPADIAMCGDLLKPQRRGEQCGYIIQDMAPDSDDGEPLFFGEYDRPLVEACEVVGHECDWQGGTWKPRQLTLRIGPDSAERLGYILRPLGIPFMRGLNSLADLFCDSPQPPWAVVCLDREYEMAGHLMAARGDDRCFTFSAFSIFPGPYDVQARGAPPVDILLIHDPGQFQTIKDSSPVLKAAWDPLGQWDGSRSVMCFLPALDPDWADEVSVGDDELFLELYNKQRQQPNEST